MKKQTKILKVWKIQKNGKNENQKNENSNNNDSSGSKSASESNSNANATKNTGKDKDKDKEMISNLQKEKEEHLKIIDQLTKSLEEVKVKLQYSFAERENIRRIGASDVEKAKAFGTQSIVKDFISVMDNLERCTTAVKESDLENNPLLSNVILGVNLTTKDLQQTFNKNEITVIEVKPSDPFDSKTMNAVLHMDSPHPENTVGVVLKKGYKLKGRVIRPVDVGVVKEKEEKAE